MATPLSSGGDSPLGGDDDDDEARAVVGVTGASGKKATGGSAVAGEKRDRRATGPPTDDASGGDFRSRLKRRSVRFGADARRGEAAAAECAERQSFPYGGARGEAAASQRLSTRRSSAHQALSGGEPGGPASVLGGKTLHGDTGNRPEVKSRSEPRTHGARTFTSGRWYLRAGVTYRGDCRQPRASTTNVVSSRRQRGGARCLTTT